MDDQLLRKLTPDDLEDLGELLSEYEAMDTHFSGERKVEITDIAYAHLYTGIYLALENIEKPYIAKEFVKIIWNKVINCYDLPKEDSKNLEF